MRSTVAARNQVAVAQTGRKIFELAWAVICPPSLAILTTIATSAWSEQSPREGSSALATHLLIPLMLGGTTVLLATIFFNCRALESPHLRGPRIPATLGISTAITLMVLAVAVTSQAERSQVSEAAEIVMFLCLPVLFVCTGLLWHAASMIRSSFRRALMLAGFLAATALVELWCGNQARRGDEERLFMLNSLLVALAFTIQLCVWSAKELGRR